MKLDFAQKALTQTQGDLTTATFDGRDIILNGEVLPLEDKRRGLITHIIVLPGVTAIHEEGDDMVFSGCTSLSSINLPEGLGDIGNEAFAGCTILRSAAGLISIVKYLRFRCRVSRRVAVLASLARLSLELHARHAKRARRQAGEDAAAEEEEEEVVVDEQAGGLRGKLAFDAITSENVWRRILVFV